LILAFGQFTISYLLKPKKIGELIFLDKNFVKDYDNKKGERGFFLPDSSIKKQDCDIIVTMVTGKLLKLWKITWIVANFMFIQYTKEPLVEEYFETKQTLNFSQLNF
jgi:hypothetical protein